MAKGASSDEEEWAYMAGLSKGCRRFSVTARVSYSSCKRLTRFLKDFTWGRLDADLLRAVGVCGSCDIYAEP